MNKPKVSIILPTYNRAYILSKAINSVLNQTYKEFELIIVDDGSTDNTSALVESFHDERILYLYTQINQGAAAARNYGIEHANYDYIAFEDSDDAWHPDKLEKQMSLMQSDSRNPGFVYHKICYDMGENRYAILPSEAVPLEKKSGDIYAQLLYDNLVDCPSMLIKKSCLDDVGLFDTSLKALEDYDLALRLAKKYSAAFVNEVLLDSTYSTTGVSGSAVNYLTASCLLVHKYKKDYLATDTFNHRIQIILDDSEKIGLQAQYVNFLEKLLSQ